MPEHMDLNYKGASIDFHCRKAPEPDNLKDYHDDDWDDYRTFEPYDCGYADGYNQALKDCGLED